MNNPFNGLFSQNTPPPPRTLRKKEPPAIYRYSFLSGQVVLNKGFSAKDIISYMYTEYALEKVLPLKEYSLHHFVTS